MATFKYRLTLWCYCIHLCHYEVRTKILDSNIPPITYFTETLTFFLLQCGHGFWRDQLTKHKNKDT